MDFFGMGPLEILVIIVVALIVFGPHKLPEIARNVGKSINTFKRAASEITAEVTRELESERIEKEHPSEQSGQIEDKTDRSTEPQR